MLILSGAPALSAFRQNRLLQDLQAEFPMLTALSARWLHLVETDLSEAPEQLQALLTYGDALSEAGADEGRIAVVVPRPGTISPAEKVWTWNLPSVASDMYFANCCAVP